MYYYVQEGLWVANEPIVHELFEIRLHKIEFEFDSSTKQIKLKPQF